MRSGWIVVVAGVAVTCWAGLASANPVNDACVDAIDIVSLPWTRTESEAALAAAGSDDPFVTCTGGRAEHTVWYTYTNTATAPRRMELTTRTSYSDSFLWVGSGVCGGLTEVACNDDSAGFHNAELEFIAAPGATYYFVVGAPFPLFSGEITLNVNGVTLRDPPPSNDLCSTPTTIASIPSTILSSGFGATEDPMTDVHPPCWRGADKYTLWYRMTLPVERQVRIDTTNSTDNTWVTVLTGTCGNFTAIDCDNSSGVNAHAIVDFLARAGVTYYLQLSRVFPPSSTDQVELVVSDGSSQPITVVVTDDVSGQPIEGAHVSLRDVYGGNYLIRDGYTDRAGIVNLYPVLQDDYDAQVLAQRHVVTAQRTDNYTRKSIALALPRMGPLPPAPGERTRIAFATGDAIVHHLPDGSDETVIPVSGVMSVRFPTWSPAAYEIGFAGPKVGGRGEIWIVGADGTGFRQLSNFNGNPGAVANLTWSPRGDWFAFDDDGGRIFILDAATGTDLRLVGSGGDPTWSPDGSMLISGDRVMRVDGTHVAALPTMVGAYDWSPDGARLVTSSSESIWVMNFDGTERKKVAGIHGNNAYDPIWSADGCNVLYGDYWLSGRYPTIVAVDGPTYQPAHVGATWDTYDWAWAPTSPDTPDDRSPHVTLRAPNGGELATVGAGFDIRWDSVDDKGVVEIDLRLIRGGTETPIATSLSGSLDRYLWTVPDLPADTDARVRVTVRDTAGQRHSDTSKYPFSIAKPSDEYHALWITAPAAGATLQARDLLTIAWDNAINSPFTPSGFELELSLDGGLTFRSPYLSFGLSSADRAFDWTIPSYTTDRAFLRVRQGGADAEVGPISISPGRWSASSGLVGTGSSSGSDILYGVRAGADAWLTWSRTQLTNLHRTGDKPELGSLWGQPVLAGSMTANFRDPTPPAAPGQPWYYQIFATSCLGRSVP